MWWNSKLADWDDDEPSALPETNSKFEKVVILKHMFTLKELDVWVFFSPFSLFFSYPACID